MWVSPLKAQQPLDAAKCVGRKIAERGAGEDTEYCKCSLVSSRDRRVLEWHILLRRILTRLCWVKRELCNL